MNKDIITIEFDFRKKVLKDNENKLRVDAFIYDEKELNKKIIHKESINKFNDKVNIISNHFILNNEVINRLQPHKIDIHKFWKNCMNLDPIIPINGGNNVNKYNIKVHALDCYYNWYKTMKYVHDVLDDNKIMLEIGPGYGQLYDIFKEKKKTANYYALDVQKLFKCKNLFIGNGKSIPKEIPSELDLVFSLNVFQHLSPIQRTGYYKSVFKKLKNGGTFVFGLFGINEKNKDNEYIWGFRDKKDNRYTHFFNQFTLCPHENDVFDELKRIGFSGVKSLETAGEHYLIFEAVK